MPYMPLKTARVHRLHVHITTPNYALTAQFTVVFAVVSGQASEYC